MRKSTYFVFMRLEATIEKSKLMMGHIDADHTTRMYVSEQLDQAFPTNLYEKKNHLGFISYSLRGDLPAKALTVLRKKIYSLMDIKPNLFKENELEEELKDLTVKQWVETGMQCIYDVNLIYPFFQWRQCRQWLPVDAKPDGFHGRLPITAGGMQIYCSENTFETELSGELYLMTNPLKKLLGDDPLADLVSVEILDL